MQTEQTFEEQCLDNRSDAVVKEEDGCEGDGMLLKHWEDCDADEFLDKREVEDLAVEVQDKGDQHDEQSFADEPDQEAGDLDEEKVGENVRLL